MREKKISSLASWRISVTPEVYHFRPPSTPPTSTLWTLTYQIIRYFSQLLKTHTGGDQQHSVTATNDLTGVLICVPSQSIAEKLSPELAFLGPKLRKIVRFYGKILGWREAEVNRFK